MKAKWGLVLVGVMLWVGSNAAVANAAKATAEGQRSYCPECEARRQALEKQQQESSARSGGGGGKGSDSTTESQSGRKGL